MNGIFFNHPLHREHDPIVLKQNAEKRIPTLQKELDELISNRKYLENALVNVGNHWQALIWEFQNKEAQDEQNREHYNACAVEIEKLENENNELQRDIQTLSTTLHNQSNGNA